MYGFEAVSQDLKNDGKTNTNVLSMAVWKVCKFCSIEESTGKERLIAVHKNHKLNKPSF